MNAKKGDAVKVHYILRDVNDEVIESTHDSVPLKFTLGDRHVITGFDNGVTGMCIGEKKRVHIPFADAYGPWKKEKVFEFDKSKAPANFDPLVGQSVKLHRADGTPVVVTITERTKNGYMMDANHPLAGKDLTFDLELVEIVSSRNEE
ncbi:MAG: FKBP-type peptidyl-prolyl cis-trans isomerase [Nitrospirae bacterium]|nr:FKBP-type peptidyl-prolyl cis-trans isomerase [Nitrospirota bacterium]